MNKFERKFGKYAIPRLPLIMIVCYAMGYIIRLVSPDAISYLTLNAYMVLFKGQVWRLLSWILIPPFEVGTGLINILSLAIMMYFYWVIGNALERVWGTYRFNLYIFSGLLFTIVGSFVALGYSFLTCPEGLDPKDYASLMNLLGSYTISTGYINTAMLLAFATTFPDHQVLLMFFIPIKVKWLGVVYGIMVVWEAIRGGTMTYTLNGIPHSMNVSAYIRISIIFAFLNFVIFFLLNRRRTHRSPRQTMQAMEFHRKADPARGARISKHRCAVCDRTGDTHPDMEFRFCSKCNGNYEYCNEHLFSHKHVE